jgi:hypothetical protein
MERGAEGRRAWSVEQTEFRAKGVEQEEQIKT